MGKIMKAGLAFLAGAALLYLRRRRAAPGRVVVDEDDCGVSECGADGVPISRYAG